MKIRILFLITFITYLNAFSQTDKNFSPCSEKIEYTVNDSQLKQKTGERQLPELNPKFIGGIEELKKYFAENKLTKAEAKDIIFRVHVGFAVNCKGEIGDFQLVSNDNMLSREVLNVVSKMPQTWNPGKANSQAIDSYQILSFTIVDGDLTKVSYR